MTYNDDFDSPVDDEAALAERPVDPKVTEAKTVLLEFFAGNSDAVFYERQLQVRFEKRFFHWITAKALRALVDEGRIESDKGPLFPGTPTAAVVQIRFYWSKRNRYWRRQAERIRKLVASFSTEGFGRGLGRHGEMMFDAALPRVGFVPVAADVSKFDGKRWTKTGDNLDRVFERKGIYYGLEIKNKLSYIDREEFVTKLKMCEFLGLRPLFVMRQAPKSYIYELYQAGGYALIFGFQLYPHGLDSFAKEIRDGLGLPVDCPRAIASGTLARLRKWLDGTASA